MLPATDEGRADGIIIHVLRGNVKRGGPPLVWKNIKNAGGAMARASDGRLEEKNADIRCSPFRPPGCQHGE